MGAALNKEGPIIALRCQDKILEHVSMYDKNWAA